ncbi:SURF1 family protein [Canibacter sp. lx-72]|uniref:SURF1 family cytochrome oxidase biogenesis protein n=1 Tax=Canibacter zhuwentaonis TaxID=2837491 RepID=UPI001BDD23D7|nr:SURF1 family protein [Canibacter zhuwentaonis]
MTAPQNQASGRGWSFLYARRWLGYYAMLLVFALVCVALSNWQFARKAQAQAEIDRIVTNYDAPATPFQSLVTNLTEFHEDTQKWRPVTATGKYTAEFVLVRNRPGLSGTGSHILQAFKTAEGITLFVDRGWSTTVITDSATPDPNSLELATSQQEITLTARLRQAEPVISGRTPTAHSIGSINPAEAASITNEASDSVYTAGYLALISETPAQAHGILAPRPALDPGPHLSYALQWLVFIIIAGTGITLAAKKEFQNFNPNSQKVRRQQAKKALRESRKPQSDEAAEDAWLNARS